MYAYLKEAPHTDSFYTREKGITGDPAKRSYKP
jgi:hypothetical protein